MKIYNNLTRKKEEFVPVVDGEVRFYSCGATTYELLHIGNGRAFVVGDQIYRIFLALGYDVKFVRNFTDVDDKIIAEAAKTGIDPLEHSAKFVDECLKDMESLNLVPATYTPKVSETMDEIIQMVADLIEKGAAYVVDGEVFYHVPQFKEYGKLSKKDLESLEHGIRVDVDSKKRHPSDFVLWKPAKEGEPSWKSPWGEGRPGWHIECSAMAKKFLGETIDIHHGGLDLMFPHHENEIAQSEVVNGKSFSNCWCHNEMINLGKEKMSKSLGNVITIRSFVEKYGGEVLRQVISSAHYRSKMEWSEDVIDKAFNEVERIHEFLAQFNKAKSKGLSDSEDEKDLEKIKAILPKMKFDLGNDFNIPGAMAHFFSMIRMLNRDYLNDKAAKKLSSDLVSSIEEIIEFTKLATGLVYDDPAALLNKINGIKKSLKGGDQVSDEEIEQLIADRKTARATKDWAKADEIRDRLQELGVVVKDNPDGTVSWSFK